MGHLKSIKTTNTYNRAPTPIWQRRRGRSQKKVETTQALADIKQEAARDKQLAILTSFK
jgi:hypothetical protein